MPVCARLKTAIAPVTRGDYQCPVLAARVVVLADGLYQVTTSLICAGFVIEEGRLKYCAPVLRKKFDTWWKHRATLVPSTPF